MELYDVVMKLNGPVMPVGDSRRDEDSLKNLAALCDLVDRLHTEIDDVANMNGWDHMASVKKTKDYAGSFLSKLGIED